MLFLLDANIRDDPGDVLGVTLSFLFLQIRTWGSLPEVSAEGLGKTSDTVQGELQVSG